MGRRSRPDRRGRRLVSAAAEPCRVMTGPVAAALALSVAVLVLPSSPRRRLACDEKDRKELPPQTAGWLAACVLAVSIVLLPLTTVFASVIFAASMYLRYRRRRRSGQGRQESQELETAIDVLVGELRIGAHPAGAFAVAAEETNGPVAGACRAVAGRARLGADVTAGLRGVATTSALSAQWDRLPGGWAAGRAPRPGAVTPLRRAP